MYKNSKTKFKTFSIGLIIVLFLGIIPQTANAAVSTGAVFSLTNSARAQNGVPALSMNGQLNQAATLKAQDMLNKGYFAHTSPEGLTSWHWFKLVGYGYKTAGENLAIDFSDSNSVFNAWMASPSHRSNILDPDFSEIGIAAVSGNFNGRNTTVVVQMFGTRYGVNAPVSQQSEANVKNNSTRSQSGTVQNSQNSNQNRFNELNELFKKFQSTYSDVSTDMKKVFTDQVLLA